MEGLVVESLIWLAQAQLKSWQLLLNITQADLP
jgi:hypothetical protein